MSADTFPCLVKALTTAVAEASASPDPVVRAAWAEAAVRAVLGEGEKASFVGYYNGAPIHEMSRDQLIATVLELSGKQKLQASQHARDLDFLAGRR
jgi:hypothetical protein